MVVNSRRAAICLVFLLLLAYWTITPFCGWIFQCGCTFSEGIRYCNIWDNESSDCPWCSHGRAGFYVPLGLILVSSAVTSLAVLYWSGQSLAFGMAAVAVGYFLWGSVVGFLTALVFRYPVFYGWPL